MSITQRSGKKTIYGQALTHSRPRTDTRLIVLVFVGLMICLRHIPAINPKTIQVNEPALPIWCQSGSGSAGLYLFQNSNPPDSFVCSNVPPDVAPLFFKPIPINKASAEILATLPGIGIQLAENIIRYRLQNSSIKNEDDLQNIKGIGRKKAANILEHIAF